MVRKLLSIFFLITISCCLSHAQTDALKQAKAMLKNGDVKELQNLVDKIIENETTKNIAETGHVAGKVQQRKAELQMENA